MRTFDRDTYLKAQRLWDEGGYGWRWRSVRRVAADRGFILPPEGTVHDDRDSDNPSQRAIIYSALEDNPTEIERIVRRSRSWWDVVNGIIGMEARLSAEAYERERDDGWERKDDPGHKEAVTALAAIITRIEDAR